LPFLKAEDLEKKTKTFVAALNGLTIITYARTNDTLTRVMEWPWDVAVGPVLEALDFSGVPGEGDVWPHYGGYQVDG